ncbi:MAG: TIGR01777 family protein [Candidatus Eisenbacteria bacterium]|uniref:TIGR01777 family protein n=1 Tax=Eiseniibacteriota bacterium TaxID=2212470 RepID=A0A933SFF1_UNCEI|nr:TIGR01777 family protein [Candidatus Eisenbacteria bacterium]
MPAPVTLRTTLPVPADAARAYLAHPRAASRLSPPWGGPVLAPGGAVHAEGAACVLEESAAPESGAVEALAWRHRTAALDLARPVAPLRVGVTGASGMIGRALIEYLELRGCTVTRFVRGSVAGHGTVAWDPARGTLDPRALESLDAVVHLAGAGIADERWTDARKRELVESRVQSTGTLARAMASAAGSGGARVLLSTSAIGAYGDRGDEKLDEAGGYGRGFLADLARQWEGAAAPAAAAGVRVAHPRIGVVLWPAGGALPKLVTPALLGAGGPLGSGRQWWSWVSLHDVLDALVFALDRPLAGPYNVVAPESARQRDFAAALGRALSRPAFLPAPAFALRLLLGEMADEALLAGQRLVPRALREAGFVHRDTDLEATLRLLLGRAARKAAA